MSNSSLGNTATELVLDAHVEKIAVSIWKPGRFGNDQMLYIILTVQERVGLRGALRLKRTLDPHQCASHDLAMNVTAPWRHPKIPMKYEVLYRGAFAMLKVAMEAGERIKAEPGAMVAKSDNIILESKIEGGLLGGLSRKLAGESLFMQSLVAKGESGEVLLAPAYLGEIADVPMTESVPYLVQKDGFFAGSDELTSQQRRKVWRKVFFPVKGFSSSVLPEQELSLSVHTGQVIRSTSPRGKTS